MMTNSSIKYLIVILINADVLIEAFKIFNITTVTRIKRSGGFPKFPLDINQLTVTNDNQQNSNEKLMNVAEKIQIQLIDEYGDTNNNINNNNNNNNNNINGYQECGTRSVDFYPKRKSKIIGGNVAPYGAFPWQVEIEKFHYDKMIFEHHCGGAVVGEHLVVTAAHCTEVPLQHYLRIVIGKHNLIARDLYEHSFRVEQILTHPDFRRNGPYSNDIALIKVKASSASGIHFNTHVKPICLPEIKTQKPRPGKWCSVTGWGAQKAEDLNSIAPVLRAAVVPLLDHDTCRMADINGGRQQEILDTMLCAGFLQGGVDACGGDSGGPLACEYDNKFVLVGVVSWGDGCAKKNRPGVYTRVDSFIDWIHESIKILNEN